MPADVIGVSKGKNLPVRSIMAPATRSAVSGIGTATTVVSAIWRVRESLRGPPADEPGTAGDQNAHLAILLWLAARC
jgi:hypothetical protein